MKKLENLVLFESFTVDNEINYPVLSVNEKQEKEQLYDRPDIKKIQADLDKLFKETVPAKGTSETIEGEMVRAISFIWYRYYNDGDYFFSGYGKEVLKSSVDWLKEQSPIKKELSKCFAAAKAQALPQDSMRGGSNRNRYTEKDLYLKNIIAAGVLIIDYVNNKKGDYTPLDTSMDSRDYKSNRKTSSKGKFDRGYY